MDGLERRVGTRCARLAARFWFDMFFCGKAGDRVGEPIRLIPTRLSGAAFVV